MYNMNDLYKNYYDNYKQYDDVYGYINIIIWIIIG